jgi:hypothetical protein
VLLSQDRVINFEPTFNMSAPLIGRKPVPEIVTMVVRLLGPRSGTTRVIMVVVSVVAVSPHTRAASPG